MDIMVYMDTFHNLISIKQAGYNYVKADDKEVCIKKNKNDTEYYLNNNTEYRTPNNDWVLIVHELKRLKIFINNGGKL